jgi:uncharacterized Zn-binding protein involved in type VI secretion
MPSVSRIFDTVLSPDGQGYYCRVPVRTSIITGEATVLVNFLPVSCAGDAVAPHPAAPCYPDISFIVAISTVTAGFRPVASIGCETVGTAAPNIIVLGSPNVFVGL